MASICGREYEVKAPMIKHEKDRRKAKPRILVQGSNRADGSPIRFKSTARAERHLKNMLRLD